VPDQQANDPDHEDVPRLLVSSQFVLPGGASACLRAVTPGPAGRRLSASAQAAATHRQLFASRSPRRACAAPHLHDPALGTDALLDEFFRLCFGRAARPMNQFYRSIERIACNQALYPPKLHRQNKDIAWANLGTPDRMKNLAALMAEAEARAGMDIDRQRVALERNSIWQWMLDGRANYEARHAAAAGAP
jgi:hypothetical protein